LRIAGDVPPKEPARYAHLLSLAADPAATAAFCKPWPDGLRAAGRPAGMQPFAAESE